MSRGLPYCCPVQWGALVSLWLFASPASAQLTVSLEGCRSVVREDVAAALELELGVEASASLSVRVVCEDDAVTIEVVDRTSERPVSRRVEGVDAGHPGAAQIVALLASELVLASWVERLVGARAGPLDALAEGPTVEPPRPPENPPSPIDETLGEGPSEVPEAVSEDAAAQVSEAAPEDAAETEAVSEAAVSNEVSQNVDVVAPPVTAARTSLRLDLGGGVRLRDVGAPFVPVFIGLRGLVPIDGGCSIGLRASVEVGEIARNAGTISHAAVGAGLVLGWEALREQDFVLDLFFEARGAWVRLDARPARTSVEGRALDAPLVELEATLAPSFVIGVVDIALEASLGVTVVGPVGTVTAEPDVTLPGLFFAVGLAFGLR